MSCGDREYHKRKSVEWYIRNADAARARGIERGRVGRATLDAIKLERGCIDCGYNASPEALHFDHRDPDTKSGNLSNMVGFSNERLLEEVNKCDVRCANCHAVRSKATWRGGRPRIIRKV